ncbi:MAG TPA: hydroxymethylbilane synthase [Parasegetibacter sp.]|jgi:hydroxymethylbilane synthase
MNNPIRIGTRDSQLALWQANKVLQLLSLQGHTCELVLIKSDGDTDLVTPLYELGVQGVFTKTLDAALLSGRIDIAVHSMKDVPTQLAKGISEAAILERASHKDILVHKGETSFLSNPASVATIATSSVRRRAQWLYKYPNHEMVNIRGNVNTRLRKVQDNNWQGAIFAAAGLERIELRPENSMELDWMLPAPAQGAILVVCREEDFATKEKCLALHHSPTAICVKAERDFLRTLMGGCSTPISAWARIENSQLRFTGNITTPNGKESLTIDKTTHPDSTTVGIEAAKELIANAGNNILELIQSRQNNG